MSSTLRADLLSIPIARQEPSPASPASPNSTEKPSWLGYFIFIFFHVACLAVFFVSFNLLSLGLCALCYLIQMFGITAGYHRYFSHRAFKTSRAFQFALACLGCSASQNGPSWWVARHRHHHRTSDSADDLHSPVAHSFWWSHAGWILSRASDGTDRDAVKDLRRCAELRLLDRLYWAPPLALAGMCFLIGGWSGLVWGFLVSTVLSHHATFTVNSICHLWGQRRRTRRSGSEPEQSIRGVDHAGGGMAQQPSSLSEQRPGRNFVGGRSTSVTT